MGVFDSRRTSGRSNSIEKSETKLILSDKSPWPIQEAYKALRTNITFSLPGTGCKVIAVSSAQQHDGKSTICINTAISFAQLNKKVLLIECDLRLPTVGTKLEIRSVPGLSDTLIGSAQISEALRRNVRNGLDVLPAGNIPPDPTWLLQSNHEKNSKLLQFVWKKFKRLIIPFAIMLYCYYKPMSYLTGTSHFVEQGSLSGNVNEYLKVNTTGALWYLYVLFAIFVFNKLICFIWKRNSTIIAALILFAVVSYYAQVHYSGGTVHHLLMYNFYFYLGTCIHYYYNSVIKRNKIFLMGVFLISAVTVSAGMIDSKYFRCILVMIAAISAIHVTYAVTDKYRCSAPSKSIEVLDDYSYGIYLFHTPIIELIATHMRGAQALLIILATFFAGLILSMILTKLIRTVHLNFILGETVRKTNA